jgi:hypothetical protein
MRTVRTVGRAEPPETRCDELFWTLRDLCDWALELPTGEFYEHLWRVIYTLADDVWLDECSRERSA